MGNWIETDFGQIPNTWQISTLGQICSMLTDGSHFSPKEVESEFMMLSVKDMTYSKFDFSNAKTISARDFENLVRGKCSPELGDILLSKDGANCLDLIFVYKQNEKIVLLSSIAIARLNEGYNPDFFRYFLLSPGIQYLMRNNFVSGSAIPRVILKDFKNVPVPIPSLKEQQSIASVLSSLDDKIDLLHRQNKTLEQMAETLFRQWFVEGKEDSIIRDEFNVTMGQSPPGDSYNENQEGILFFQGRTDFGFRFPAPRIYCSAPTRFAEKYDTLMSVRAPVGDLNYAEERCCIGRGLAAISHKNKSLHHSYAYYTFKFLKNDFDIHEDSGTIFGSINKDELLNIKCPKIEIEKIELYNKEIGLLDDKLVLNCKQIKKLEQLRDSLLPKLMNGSIRVINQ